MKAAPWACVMAALLAVLWAASWVDLSVAARDGSWAAV